MGTARRSVPLIAAVFAMAPVLAAQSLVGKRAVVYTTADSTALRLTPADTLVFQEAAPITEAQVYVFVDPQHAFQTMIGIGGALAAAGAARFARLPARRLAQRADAYYIS